jgi:uncharacterized membrane protein (UPF0127 family)
MAKSGTNEADSPIRVENLTREQTLVTAGWAADNHWTRLRGLLGHKGLPQGEGLLIVPCNSIHMLFMGFPIDVLYVDSALKVIGLHHTLRPWRFGRLHLRSRFVIELPASTLRATGTQVGDQLQVQGYQF